MNELTQRILTHMQKRGRIELLIFLFEMKEGIMQWQDVKKKLGFSDGTYRFACRELVDLGLAKAIPLGPLKNSFRLTDQGCLVASLIDEKVKDLDFLVSNSELFK